MNPQARNANTIPGSLDERPRGRHRAEPEPHPSGPIPVVRDLRPPHPSGPIDLVGAPPLAELPKDLSDEQLREFLAAARALRRTGPIPIQQPAAPAAVAAPADPAAEQAIRSFTRPIDLPVPAPGRAAAQQPAHPAASAPVRPAPPAPVRPAAPAFELATPAPDAPSFAEVVGTTPLPTVRRRDAQRPSLGSPASMLGALPRIRRDRPGLFAAGASVAGTGVLVAATAVVLGVAFPSRSVAERHSQNPAVTSQVATGAEQSGGPTASVSDSASTTTTTTAQASPTPHAATARGTAAAPTSSAGETPAPGRHSAAASTSTPSTSSGPSRSTSPSTSPSASTAPTRSSAPIASHSPIATVSPVPSDSPTGSPSPTASDVPSASPSPSQTDLPETSGSPSPSVSASPWPTDPFGGWR